jgi:nucleoid DNA-binding protein
LDFLVLRRHILVFSGKIAGVITLSLVRTIPHSEAPTMTKKEIVRSISEKLNMTQLKTKDIVQNVFDCIVDTLVEEGRIELRNFGVFEVKKRAARKARNPKTGDEVLVKEKFVVAFKSGKALEDALQDKEKRRKRK